MFKLSYYHAQYIRQQASPFLGRHCTYKITYCYPLFANLPTVVYILCGISFSSYVLLYMKLSLSLSLYNLHNSSLTYPRVVSSSTVNTIFFYMSIAIRFSSIPLFIPQLNSIYYMSLFIIFYHCFRKLSGFQV